MRSKPITDYLLIVLIGAMLFIPFLGSVHLFDWDEINFAECAREMIVTGDYSKVMINFQPFWEKPPLFIWMQAASMNIFGINEFAARFPNAICGIITLLVIYNIGTNIYDRKFGRLWVLSYVGSFLPHFYFKSGIIDPWFNLFIFSGIYYLIIFTNNTYNTPNNKNLIISGFFTGLAVLTKGPVAVLIIGLCICIYWLKNRNKKLFSGKQIFLFILISGLTGSLWFIIEILQGRPEIILEFIQYQIRLFKTEDAGHGGPWFYHPVVLLIGCFPASIFAIQGFKKSYDTPFQKYFKLWMIILFWVVLILFSVVKTKIVHYSSLCWLPLTFLSAYCLFKIFSKEFSIKLYQTYLLFIIGLVIGIVLIGVQFADKYKEQIKVSNIIRDPFALENLMSKVHWTGYEFLIGLFFLAMLFLTLRFFYKRKLFAAVYSLFISTVIVITLTSIIIVPKIESYSQNAAIEFYKTLQGKDIYIETIGFKSYAHLYYSAKRPVQNKNSLNTEWLLKDKIDKPAYFVSKVTGATAIKKSNPKLIELYRKNGFVFYKRE